MSSDTHDLTRDGLILKGLEGKDKAIAAYDEMLWKIRTGYAAVLYGIFTLVVSLGDKTKWLFSMEIAGPVAVTLITGFTICAAALDFSVLRSKFRVIQAKEELVDLALQLASGGKLEQWRGSSLNTLLHNSGEGPGTGPVEGALFGLANRAAVPWHLGTPMSGSPHHDGLTLGLETAPKRGSTEGAVLVATIFAWNYRLDWLAYRFPRVHRLLNPPPLLLIENGRLQGRNLRAEMLTKADLAEQLREQGIEDFAEVRRCYLEGDGHLSVIRRSKDEKPPPRKSRPMG